MLEKSMAHSKLHLSITNYYVANGEEQEVNGNQ